MEKYLNVYATSVLDRVKEGYKVYCLDRLTREVFCVNELPLDVFVAELYAEWTDESKDERYYFWAKQGVEEEQNV